MSDRTVSDRIDEPPLVTVAIPTYNRVGLLEGALESALAQTHRPLEVIICDNGSTDGTEAFSSDAAAADPRIRYIRQPTNLGPMANFDRARDAATGEFFMWLADDDRIPPDYVEQCLAVLRAEPSVALAAGVPNYYEDGEFRHEGVRVEARGDDPLARVLAYYRQVIDNGTYYGLMPLDLLQRTARLRERMGFDWLLLAEIAMLGEIRTVPSVEIHRDLVVDYTFERMAAAGGHTRFEGRYPYVAICGLAAWEPLRGNAGYRTLGWRRLELSVRSAAVILRRFVLTGLRPQSLRRRVRSWRSRRTGSGH